MARLFRVKGLLLLFFLFSEAAYCIRDSDLHALGSDERHARSGSIQLKLQGLNDLSLGQWRGEERLETSTESGASGKTFCVISFSKNAWYGWHDYHSRDYEMRLRGPVDSDGRFALRSFRGEIPVSFSLQGKGRTVVGQSKIFTREDSIYIHSYDNPDETCDDYAFLLSAQVNRNDILANGSEGRFWGFFQLDVRDVHSGLTLTKIFRVAVRIRKTFRLSGIRDVFLDARNVNGEWLFKNMDFCVHVLNGGWYRINVQGQNNPDGELILRNGPNTMPYRMSYQTTHDPNWHVINRSGYFGQYFQGSRSFDCDGTSNATIRVEIHSNDLRNRHPGSYTDVVEVTVGAN